MRIQKGATNNVTVTVTEKTTLSDPYYLFEFIGASKNKVYCICSVNLSSETLRYDKFEIIETTSSVNPVAHRVTLEPGDNIYNVYEQESSTNTNPSGLTLVETGICEVYGAESSTATYSPETTRKIYNG